MKKNAQILLIGSLFVIAAAGWVYLSQQDLAPQTEQAGQADAAAQASVDNSNALRKNFETLLNDFLQDVATKAQEYTRERRVLAELVRPQNLRAPEYVDQNYDLMKSTVPALHLKIDELMLVFEDTETKVNALLVDQPEEVRATISEEWKKMKTEQASTYIGFFEIEEQILQAYEELMTYYYSKKGAYTFDEAQQKIVFKDLADEAPVTQIQQRLVELAQKESELVKAGG